MSFDINAPPEGLEEAPGIFFVGGPSFFRESQKRRMMHLRPGFFLALVGFFYALSPSL